MSESAESTKSATSPSDTKKPETGEPHNDWIREQGSDPNALPSGEQSASTGGAPTKRNDISSRSLSPFEEFERKVESLFSSPWLRPFSGDHPLLGELKSQLTSISPRIDVIDREQDVLVKAEVPGFDKHDLEISVANNTVTIRGFSAKEEKSERDDYFRSEISRNSFVRTVALPTDVDGSQARASYKDGMLELMLPKHEGARRHKITVE